MAVKWLSQNATAIFVWFLFFQLFAHLRRIQKRSQSIILSFISSYTSTQASTQSFAPRLSFLFIFDMQSHPQKSAAASAMSAAQWMRTVPIQQSPWCFLVNIISPFFIRASALFLLFFACSVSIIPFLNIY